MKNFKVEITQKETFIVDIKADTRDYQNNTSHA